MGFAILGEHREHFAQKGYVEFEELLAPDEVSAAFGAIGKSVKSVPTTARDSIRVGRDLWRTDAVLSKIARSRRLAEVAAALLHTNPLRLAYDQLIWHTGRRDVRGLGFDPQASLSDVSAFEGVRIGLVLCIQDGDTASPLLPTGAGSGVYFSSQMPIDWEPIETSTNGVWWLLVYGRETMLYVLNSRDPHVHLPKRYGYVFGDRLRDEDYPKLVH